MTVKIETTDAVVTDRGGIVENRHRVHAAVVDSNGKLLYAVGDPTRMTLARSAAKPFQALAILETGGFDQFGLDDADLALMCASHSSEDRHIAHAHAMLGKVDAKETDLQCGGHAALSEAANRVWIKNDYTPTAICNNCSGKHAGMLAGARALGAELEDYHLPAHPLQVHVRRVVEEVCEPDAKLVRWGLDGCNLPAPATPLYTLGKAYATLAAAADAVAADPTCDPQTQSLGRIYGAMAQYPELVGGEGRFCTDLATAFQGELIGKVGADGCYGVAIRASQETKRLGGDGALGIAVKIEDGNMDILYAAVAEILEQLQIGSPEMRNALDHFHYPKLCNTAGVVTGHVSHSFKVRSALVL
ncbi:hypothetical protein ASPWEDRAFT_130022 [Aspergillus wentii DTO 134E9]|uniref:L-asparaginase II n=1 Tax=Aspergillus wentii DTO 134E9 TaxID=1073089 RepID=A0A1L9RN67_ASPWE|nr:uncharacterized protein ASPWEDRAFT_130022 [Aspergillus wentii DTO 134E9]KAI9926057.1 hypothetical protein MW887_004516 [Aspergillus wentii]OJJ36399.1 hypothetical protein ASPWEDRAFT_130022 [Aspergillus wentii DTO 134E9]